jgi:circadian clock protein KaiB
MPGMWVFTLYISGHTPLSENAIANLGKICEEHLYGRYKIEVVDVCEHPELAMKEQIIALPTLVKELPLPVLRVIGDLADTKKVLVGLEIQRY